MARRPTPDLAGQVIAITGASSGIGKEAAVALAAMGATVVMTARNPTKGQAAWADVVARSGGDVELMALDLADFASIRAFADDLRARHDRLDVLVNNAGGLISARERTAQGFEMTFGVNHLGHFLLTSLLLDRLCASAPARVVTVSSVGHRYAIRGLSFDDLQSDRRYQSMDVYAKSKLANLLFSNELARRLEGTGVTSNALHPGAIRSGFGRSEHNRGIDRATMVVGAPFLRSPRSGAKTTVYLASSPEVAGATGGYYVRRKLHRPSRRARDEDAARRLWDASEALIAEVDA
jgi:NAD(P)-dependent dehydrogenase (short-subunit alcohol dehydrogenase family)